jgi:hypothetical protein
MTHTEGLVSSRLRASMAAPRYQMRRYRGGRSLASYVVEILQDNGGASMTVEDLAQEVQRRGFSYAAKPKNPDQLKASISAMPHKTPLIRRVSFGRYGLTELGKRAEFP